MLKELKIYRKLTKILLLSGVEYKGWWMMFLYVLFSLATEPLVIILMFSRFGSIGEWSMERILLVYALAMTAYGIAKIICVGFEDFPWEMIQRGEFDRFLLRPCSLFTQIIGSRFRPRRIPWIITGMAAIIWSLSRLNISLNLFNVAVLIFALLGGFLIYTGVFIITSGVAFFTLKGLDWTYIFTNRSREVTKCPVEYMPKILRGTFTFIIPMLVISYYPASLVCGWGEPAFTGFLALPVGVAFFSISLFVWKIGVRHYKSAGS